MASHRFPQAGDRVRPERLSDVSLDVPTVARMYDAALGGKDNFEVDRAANKILYERIGEHRIRSTVMENRRFLVRAVRHLARDRGITQFLDMGSGLPTAHNTHQVAQESAPDAKVVYVDVDPIVAVHGRAILAGRDTRIVTADMRDPASVLDHPDTRELIDFSRPVAVLFVAVFHFMAPEDDPAGIIAAVRERQAPGSYIAISHLSREGMPEEDQRGWEAGFAGTTTRLVLRSEREIGDLFHGYDLVEPGLVRPYAWHPDEDGSPETTSLFGGVGRLPATP